MLLGTIWIADVAGLFALRDRQQFTRVDVHAV